MKPRLIFDIETYVNYLLIMFQNEQGKTAHWEMHNDKRPDKARLHKLRALIHRHTLVGFNSDSYDVVMLTAFLDGYTNAQLKKLSDYLIKEQGARWRYSRIFDMQPLKVDSIDLINVAPGVASLKIYGGRLHAPRLQDLPIEPSATISASDAAELRTYCINDLDTTAMLGLSLAKQLDLRVNMSDEYGQDLRSKSDAQIAETVLNSELTKVGVNVKKPNIPEGTKYKYNIPSFIEFSHPELVSVLEDIRESDFVINDKGSVIMPPTLHNRKIPVGNAKYKMGIGGLHSTEKAQVVRAVEGYKLFDIDVASYYPNIILGDKLYPKHLTPKFLDVYERIVKTRLAAKAAGDKVVANSLKITINGSFGKLGSKYSTLYSPDLLIQVTITGQLSLLMLIERIEDLGVSVVSANTDGIVVNCPDDLKAQVEDIVLWWEFSTGYEMDYVYYSALYSRDVNNYIAVKTDGGAKGKGAFASPGLMKNPNNLICVKAVTEHLTKNIPISETIRACDDITQFVTIRTVKGGAVQNGEKLGKAVRWYYSTEMAGQTINYSSNGNKVPKSDGAKPCMNLPTNLPADIDYQWYINEANSMLVDLGVNDA